MIKDIPTPEELERSSLDLLNMAWDRACGIIAALKESNVQEWDDDGSARREYHEAAQPSLGNAFVIIQQAQELALKARIAAVSPYLLIAGDPRSWPKGAHRMDASFSEFRTIDASDLIRVHNTVCPNRVHNGFAQLFEQTRRRRNLLVHLGRKQQSDDAQALLVLILRTMRALFPDRLWTAERYQFALRDHRGALGYTDYIEVGLVHEFEMLLGILGAKDLRENYGFDKKARRYICLHCTAEQRSMEGTATPLAQLRPNTPDATTLYCCTCADEYPVVRRRCPNPGCRSDVFSTGEDDTGGCLVCLDEPPRRAVEGKDEASSDEILQMLASPSPERP
jgi:hypothetical protein